MVPNFLNLGTRLRRVVSHSCKPHEIFSYSEYSRQVKNRDCGFLHEDYKTVMADKGITIPS